MQSKNTKWQIMIKQPIGIDELGDSKQMDVVGGGKEGSEKRIVSKQ